MTSRLVTTRVLAGAGLMISLLATTLTGCGPKTSKVVSARQGTLLAVGAENQYANVISQIGGRYVTTVAVMSNPNTDPHTFESSPAVANQVAKASLVVQNGLGYDGFMNKIEAASPDSAREVISAQQVLKLPSSTANPHLWYSETTMPAVAAAIARDLGHLDPSHAAYFTANLRRFVASLGPWKQAVAAFAAAHPRTQVAVTEPVADYLLQAAGCVNLTPWNFQADIMNGVDPSPQDLIAERRALSTGQARVFVYNQQVTDSVTQSLLQLAHKHHVPVVGVYETMPTPGYTYQSWMRAEVKALDLAVTRGVSSSKL